MAEEENIHRKQRQEREELLKARQAEEQLKAALRIVLEVNAYDRMTNVQHANSRLFLEAAQRLITMYQRTGRRLRDEEVRRVLSRLQESSTPKTEIRFARK